MKTTKYLLLFFIFISLVPTVYAEEVEVNLSNVPQQLSQKLGIPLFASQLLCSGMVVFLPILTIAILARGRYRHSWIAELFVGFMFMAFAIALQWCPYWLLIILAMLISLMFARQMRELITGR